MVWGLHSSTGEALPPRVFTSGKSQEEVIDEILEAFEDHRIVFLRGGVGSGKSIIGATVAGILGRATINVPVKPLQEQYQKDYEGRLFIKINGRPLKIRVLKGRDNFRCKKILGGRVRCSSRSLPCTMPLARDLPRWKVARRCRYWSPIYPHDVKPLRKEEGCQVLEYDSMGGTQYIYQRREGCGYYDQNRAYLEADILVYNNAKWQVDSLLGRKPKVEVEVFDEADLFLDGLTLRSVISEKMVSLLQGEAREAKGELYKEGRYSEGMAVESMAADFKKGFEELLVRYPPYAPHDFTHQVEVFLRELLDFLTGLESDYAQNLKVKFEEVLKYQEITSFYTERDRLTFFVAEPAKVLQDMLERSAKRILFMSATLQAIPVLREVYGIQDFALVEGETRMPGRMYVKRTGRERMVNWKIWQREDFRREYWENLSEILRRAERPTLVQVHAYQYLPEGTGYPEVPAREDLMSMNQEDGITSFKRGGDDILFSTKTDRGIDLPGKMCRSIVIMKYPYPSMKDPLFTVMKKRLGERTFWNYYNDMARRDFIQQVGRGLRSRDDWIEIWSPDLKVHQELARCKPRT